MSIARRVHSIAGALCRHAVAGIPACTVMHNGYRRFRPEPHCLLEQYAYIWITYSIFMLTADGNGISERTMARRVPRAGSRESA